MTPETGGFKKEHPFPGFIFSGFYVNFQGGAASDLHSPQSLEKDGRWKSTFLKYDEMYVFPSLRLIIIFLNFHVFNFRGGLILRKKKKGIISSILLGVLLFIFVVGQSFPKKK